MPKKARSHASAREALFDRTNFRRPGLLGSSGSTFRLSDQDATSGAVYASRTYSTKPLMGLIQLIVLTPVLIRE